MKTIFNIILCIIFTTKIFAQDSLELIKKIPMEATLFTTDKEGSVYCVNNNNVFRYNLNGDSTGYYNTIKQGKITQIDATNPLQILIFYANIPQLIVLDKMMSEKNNLNFNNFKINTCPAVAYSADGLIWAYHTLNSELIKIDESNNIKTSSLNLQQQFQTNVQPIFITEQERNLFVIDSTIGILRFDQYGTYITTYHFFPKEMQYVNYQLYFYKNGEIASYNTRTIQEKKIKLQTPETIINARIERKRLYVLRNDCLEIFRLD